MRLFKRLPLRFKLASVAALVLYLMMVALGVLTVIMDDVIETHRAQNRSNEAIQLTERLGHSLVEMQNAVRGAVIARDPALLEPYNLEQAAYPVTLTRLEELLAARPAQADHLAKLKGQIGQLVGQHLNPEINRIATGADATEMDRSARAMLDQIKATLDLIQQAEQAEAERLSVQAASAVQRTQLGTWAVSGVTAMIGLYLAFALSNSLTRPIRSVVAAATAVARGEFGRKIAVTSEDEIGLLAEQFNAMSESLQRQSQENQRQHEVLQSQGEELFAQNEELQAQQEALTSTLEQLEDDRVRLASLNQFFRDLMNSSDLKMLSRTLLTNLLLSGPAQVGAVLLLQADGSIQVGASLGLTEEAISSTRSGGFAQQAAAQAKPMTARYPSGALLRPVYHTDLPVENELYLPIPYAEQVLAVAALGRTGPEPFAEQEIRWLEVMAVQAGAALSNQIAYEKLSSTFAELKLRTALIEDLTLDVQSERDRARSQRDNLDAILRTTSEGFWLVDESGETLLLNDRFRDMTGLGPDENPRPVEFWSRMDLRVRDREKAGELALSGNGTTTGLLELSDPEEIYLRRFSAPVYSAEGRRIGRLFSLRDVTRETAVDRMKNEFISTVSHELRTPLTSIRGYVDLILDGDAGPISPDQREFLQLVSKSTVRLASLITDLLDVEKIESGRQEMHMVPTDIPLVLEHVARSFQVDVQEKGLSLSVEVEGSIPPIMTDGDRLTQVVMNLVSNAFKYTQEGSIGLRAHMEGDSLVVAVKDSGMGIAPANIGKLFDRFFRVDNEVTRRVHGTGLGLSITRAIVRRLGGTIEVQSQVGFGSTFTVTMPLHGAPGPGTTML